MLQRCELFLKECEDGFHGTKDLGILHNLRGQGRAASEYSGVSGATSVSRRLRSYLPSKKRMPPPIEKCAPTQSPGSACAAHAPEHMHAHEPSVSDGCPDRTASSKYTVHDAWCADEAAAETRRAAHSLNLSLIHI